MAVVVIQVKLWHVWLMVKLSYQSLSCQDIVTDVWGQLIQMPAIHNWEVRIQFLGAPN